MKNFWLNVDKPIRSQVLHAEDVCWDVKRRGAGRFKPVRTLGRDGGWLLFDSVKAAKADAESRKNFKPIAYCSNCQTIDIEFRAVVAALVAGNSALEARAGTTKDLLSQVTREHVQQALTWIDSGRPNSFAESTGYDVVNEGKRYPPKRVAGVALEALTGKAFGPNDFKGGEESTCFQALRRVGFTVVRKEDSERRPLITDLQEILELQTKYSSTNTSEMVRRGQLIRKHLPHQIEAQVEQIEPIFNASGYSVCVEGSDGIGRKAESAWVRIYDEQMSPSATQGWYIVIHFSREGDYFYLTLGCGATVYRDGFLIAIPDDVVAGRIAWAKAHTGTDGFEPSDFADPIKLNGNELSRSFEKATAYSVRLSLDDFSEDKFWVAIQKLSRRLVDIYDAQRSGVDPAAKGHEVQAQQNEIDRTISPIRNGSGQGRGLSAPERIAVERQAMLMAENALKADGFTAIQDMSAKASYDFKATKGNVDWFIEVKGTTSSAADQFLLTASELRLHQEHKGSTILALVHSIQLSRKPQILATGGQILLEVPWNPDDWGFEATAFRAKRKASDL